MEHFPQQPSAKQLRRSRRNVVIAGVCGGFGEYFGVDPMLVRITFVLAGIIQGFGVLAYVACALLIPREGKAAEFVPEAPPGDGASADARKRSHFAARARRWLEGRNRQFVSVAAVGIAALALWNLVTARCGPGRVSFWNLLSYGLEWNFFWPAVLAAFGIYLMLRRPRE